MTEVAVVILNWNGAEDTKKCIEAIKKQTVPTKIILVDNGSEDGLYEQLVSNKDDIKVIRNEKNIGFSGGVNVGINYAIDNNYKYVALINNDAVPEKYWLEELLKPMDKHVGISTGIMVQPDGKLDSTGDQYSIWGLPWPRGRGVKDQNMYKSGEVFAASGGASLYKVAMFKEVGLFDNDFFAYYEDVDLSFRAQLYGWGIVFTPKAKVVHKISSSSSKVPGLTAYMMLKNMVWVFWKNVPLGLLPKMLPRFTLTYTVTFVSYLFKGRVLIALKAITISTVLLPKKLWQRHGIQKNRKVDSEYINSILLQDLPPNSRVLRKVRNILGVKK